MSETVNLARIRGDLKDKQLVGFKALGAEFPRDLEVSPAAADIATAGKTGRSKIGQPKQGQAKTGQGKPGYRKPSL
jgi:uncharacterized low-complexity protein